MELVILGSGTSVGVPTIGCDCAVCRSTDPHNKRLRSSAAIIGDAGQTLLIDSGPDLRAQALANDLRRVDAVLYTHTHADHLHGLDELRMYNYLQRAPLPIYALGEHLETIKRRFSYVFDEGGQLGGGKPRLLPFELVPGQSLELCGLRVTPLMLLHGKLPCLGFRINDIAYLTDVSQIPEAAMAALFGLKILVLGALRYRTHSTHFRLGEALEIVSRLSPKRTLLTHMNHELDDATLRRELPRGVEPAYDGLRIAF